MGKWRRTPAIFAGLAGSAVWSVPVLASAATADEVLVTLNDLLASPVAYFFIGIAAGAAVTGVAVGVSEHHAKRHLRRQLDDALAENERLRAAGGPLVIRVSSPGTVLEPLAAELGPAGDAGAGSQESRVAPKALHEGKEELDSTAHLPRVQAATSAAPVVEEALDIDEPEDVSQPGGSDVDDEPLEGLVVPKPSPNAPAHEALRMAHPSHVRGNLDATLPDLEAVPSELGPRLGSGNAHVAAGATPLPEVAPPVPRRMPTEGRVPAAAPAPSGMTPGTDVAHGASAEARRPKPEAQNSASRDDYEHVAEEYVRKSKDSERERRRSRGVRAILSERLRGNVMDGLPVIERADGSTTDIGTSWWTREVGSTHSFTPLDTSSTADLLPVTEAPDPMSTAALRADEIARAERNARVAGLSSAADETARLDATSRAAAIAQRLSSVDMSLYPEEHGDEGAGEDDMFEQALRALDAQDSAVVTTSEDAAAAPITGDIPTGAVVTPAGERAMSRDETEEHVDYLVRDELERNRARRLQRTSTHSILTVFEGTGDLSDARAAHAGRHFARPADPGAGTEGRTRGRA